MSIFEINGLSHAYGDKLIFKKESLELMKGEHMGIVGPNGCGKSTLIKILKQDIVPDDGEIFWQMGIQLGYLDQYANIPLDVNVLSYLKTAFSTLYKKEEEMNIYFDKYAVSGKEADLKRAFAYQEDLERNDFYLLDTKIETVRMGLGLNAFSPETVLNKLSGGQRAKVILAKLLLEKPDVLFLDEPTNFLDKEHVKWLGDYLYDFPNAFVVISHDKDFLDRITTCICDIELGSIRKYNAPYHKYVKLKELHTLEYQRLYSTQQREIQKTEAYIRKNIAGVNSKNAKGRRKQLEHVVRLEAPKNAKLKPKIHFKEGKMIYQKALEVKKLQVGYQKALVPELNFSIRGGEKIVLTGFNGIGKSTLLKTLLGEVKCISGEMDFSDLVEIGYYEQDLKWENPDLTPFEIMSDNYPNLKEKEIRAHLAGCGIGRDHISQAITTLSGGEQAKVKLAVLTYKPYNFLILDEPTNHLDQDAKESLKEAICHFHGTVLMVSHEERFYESFADKIWNLRKK